MKYYEQQSAIAGIPVQPMMEPRFTGLPTFLRAPAVSTLSDVDIALIGVPFDGGVTNRAGARHGPREVRNQSSLMRMYNVATRVNPYDLCRIADAGDVRIESRYDLSKSIEEIESQYRLVHAAGVVPLSVGGDHSISYPILRAIAADRPVGMVHVDAHTDTWGEFGGSKFHHGAPFRLAVENGLIDPTRTIQIGIRGGQNFLDGLEFSRRAGMRVVYIEEFADRGVAAIVQEARRIVGDRPTYLSFDVDGLDPAYAPGTGTPEAGGLTSLEALRLIRGLSGVNLIGGDLVEVAPPFDPSGSTALLAATILFEMLCVLAQARAGRN